MITNDATRETWETWKTQGDYRNMGDGKNTGDRKTIETYMEDRSTVTEETWGRGKRVTLGIREMHWEYIGYFTYL